MTRIRDLYLTAAELLAAPEVAAAWNEPSALPKLSVQGLAGHLAGQVFAVETVVDLLSRIALRRHGAISVLRALSRAERAPASISAL